MGRRVVKTWITPIVPAAEWPLWTLCHGRLFPDGSVDDDPERPRRAEWDELLLEWVKGHRPDLLEPLWGGGFRVSGLYFIREAIPEARRRHRAGVHIRGSCGCPECRPRTESTSRRDHP